MANISGKDQHIENQRKTLQTQPLPRCAKNGELWSTNNRDSVVHIDPPKWIFFGDYIRPLRGAAPSNFFTHVRD